MPAKRPHGVEYVALRTIRRMSDLQEHSAGHAAFEIRAIADRNIASELNAAIDGLNVPGPNAGELFLKDGLQASRASREK